MDVFAKAAAVGAQMQQSINLKDRINVYACTPPLLPGSSIQSGCGYWIVTIDREAGVTPMFVKCGQCGGMATSRMYKVGLGLEPTHEWYRPTSAEDLPEGYSLASVADHLANGGLLLRPIGAGRWLEPTPETVAFVREEQVRLRALMASGGPVSRQQRRHAERKGSPPDAN
jgi:hypothetical protein